jgi:hypothetical protein
MNPMLGSSNASGRALQINYLLALDYAALSASAVKRALKIPHMATG